jgi:hypothetical protein
VRESGVAYFELNPQRLIPLLNRACPHCEARMRLAVIEPAKPGRDKLIFECIQCGREDSIEVKFGRALSARRLSGIEPRRVGRRLTWVRS